MPETLKKELRKLEPEQKIKVGSKGGSMFWYVGTADDLLKNLPVYNAYCELFIKTALKNANNRLKSALATYPTLEEYAKFELAMTKPDLTVEGSEAAVAAWFNNIIHLLENIIFKTFLSAFKVLMYIFKCLKSDQGSDLMLAE